MGSPVFANHQAVIAAYQEAGTCTGAARLLTARGILTRNGNRLWYPSAVTVILARTAPELLPVNPSRGVKHAAPFIFYRLVRCWCGTVMTGWRRASGPQTGYVCYRCTRGRLDPGHGPTTVPEGWVLEWAMAEAARLRPPPGQIALGEATAEQAVLREDIERLGVAFLARVIDEPEMLTRKREIDERLTQLDLQGRIVTMPEMTWDLEPQDANRRLRAIWGAVRLDREMQPVAADWLLPPEWVGPRTPGSPVARRARTTTRAGRKSSRAGVARGLPGSSVAAQG
jgi:hypothetical protein